MRLVPLNLPLKLVNSSLLPEDDAPGWVKGTSYKKNDEVIYEHTIYISLLDNNTYTPGTYDAEGLPTWGAVSYTNAYKMLDIYNGTQSIAREGEKELYFVVPYNRANIFALFNIEGHRLRWEIREGQDILESGNENILMDIPSLSLWHYQYDPVIGVGGDIIRETILSYIAELHVWISSTNEDLRPAIGTVAVGREISIGDTLWNPTISGKDYSIYDVKERGNMTFSPGAYARTVSYKVVLPVENFDGILQQIKKVRGRPTLILGGNRGYTTVNSLNVFGWLYDFTGEILPGELASFSIVAKETA